jgi:MFS transporter, DHA3 family, macrolide efflux protein
MARLYTFYIIVITQTLSLIGSRMTSIGIGIWLFKTSGNTAPLLLVAFFNELPGMLGSSLAGVFVDRWPRRQVLILADLGQAAGSLLLMISFLSGYFQLWHLYLIVLLQGIFAIFQHPAQEAAITMLVPEQHRERANAIQQMAFPLAGVFAPVLAGLVYVTAGIAGVIAFDLATFLVAVVAICLIHIPEPQQSAEGQASQGNFWREMRGGFQYLRQRPALLSLVLYLTLINFLLNGPLELAIPYLMLVTGSETQMGWLMGVASLGAFSGATLIAMWGGSRPRIHTLLPSLLLTGVMFLVYGTARTPLLLGASIFLLMLPLPMSNALFISILQVKTPPDMQGRIFSIVAQLGFVGATTSFLLTGPLVDRLLEPAVGDPRWQWVELLVGNQPGAGIGLLLVVVGLIILTSTTLMYALPRIRRLEVTLPDYEAVAVS